MPFHNRDFIFFGLQAWDIEIGCNPRNMALVMAKQQNRILYVNRPLDRITYLTKRQDKKIQTRIASWKKGIDELNEVQPNIYVLNPRTIHESINFLPEGYWFDKLNYINAKRLAKQIKLAAERLNFKNPVLIIDNDFIKAFYLKELLPDSMLVYYIRDFLIAYPYFKKHQKMWPAFISKADRVAANSTYLTQYALQYNPHSFDIGQGCDVALFYCNDYTLPEDMQHIKGLIVGYCGALIANRLDIDLIVKIALARPQWNIVLVGKEDEAFRTSVLHGLPNVFFLGPKSFEQIPAYVQFFDVCINPQVVNEITIGNYPLKIDEYLAAGKPVVATDTIAMELFKEYVYLCRTADEYIAAIEKAVAGETEEKVRARKQFAASHTWEACVEKLYEGMEQKTCKPIVNNELY
jgi:glycosyltransferase involved in cell wall biosynthesis